jgi:hypothetical protein
MNEKFETSNETSIMQLSKCFRCKSRRQRGISYSSGDSSKRSNNKKNFLTI